MGRYQYQSRVAFYDWRSTVCPHPRSGKRRQYQHCNQWWSCLFSGLDAEEAQWCSSSVNPVAVGQGGDITIRAGSPLQSTWCTLNTTRGQVEAMMTIEASGPVSFAGLDSDGFGSFASSSVDLGGVGKGGDIYWAVSIEDGAYVLPILAERGMLAM